VKRSELRYDLPAELIAQQPASPRDAARLMIVDRAAGTIAHAVFRDLPHHLRPGDCLVVNDTRVLPARVLCRRRTGGQVEAFYLQSEEGDATAWRMLVRPSARLSVGERLFFDEAPLLTLVAYHGRGQWTVQPDPPTEAEIFLTRWGRPPLPPYISRPAGATADDVQDYQTIFAARSGAVAAPTAGLHFTPAVADALTSRGVRRAAVTLHVGLGTFAPVDCDDLDDHAMHAEWYAIKATTSQLLSETRRQAGRIVAVGTTSVRVLETLAGLHATFPTEPLSAATGWTRILIQPPHRFVAVDALLTNFHLPESTLLALVMALGGVDLIRAAYAEAVRQRYRFFSYGDAMLIL
jgi:S-adenosylmethionine:tRNA ribosyltransferase-isomerase